MTEEWPRLVKNGPDSVTVQLGPGLFGPLAEQDLNEEQAGRLAEGLQSYFGGTDEPR